MSDDEALLAAYLDGELTASEAAAFEARLAVEPDLLSRVREWREVDGAITQALAPIAQEPIPADLMGRLGLGPNPATPPSVAGPVAANDNPWYRRLALPLGTAVAASLAAVLIIAPRESASPPRDLSFALETSRSGRTVRLADGAEITPILTVQASDGRYCREYRTSQGQGLACRDPQGGWTVAATGSGGGTARPDRFAVAAGPAAAGLDAAYRRLGASDPLEASAEDRLLRNAWSAR